MADITGKKIWDVDAVSSIGGTEKVPIGKGGDAAAVATINQIRKFGQSSIISEDGGTGINIIDDTDADIILHIAAANGDANTNGVMSGEQAAQLDSNTAELATLSREVGSIESDKVDKSVLRTLITNLKEKGFYVIDDDNNAALGYDENGLNFAKISEDAINVLTKAGIPSNPFSSYMVIQTNEEGLFIADSNFNVGYSFTKTFSDTKRDDNIYYAEYYGITPSNSDNTSALQELVNKVSNNGGGVIRLSCGTYKFKACSSTASKLNTRYAVMMKSNVSIIGDGEGKTIIKQVDTFPYAMFLFFGSSSNYIENLIFKDFTIDAYDTAYTEQKVYSKAFYFQYIKNSTFKDITLQGTLATALGIDFCNNVIMESVRCIDCGRQWDLNFGGSSGIGIGTGGWEEENIIITNCICVGCGQFGIFIENQKTTFSDAPCDYSNGVVISNCTVRNSLGYGLGIRGGRHVILSNSNSYGNTYDGIRIDNKCIDVSVQGCNVSNNGRYGIYVDTMNNDCVRIASSNINNNASDGIYVEAGTGTYNYFSIRENDIIKNGGKAININSSHIYIKTIANNIAVDNTDEDSVLGNADRNIEINNILK